MFRLSFRCNFPLPFFLEIFRFVKTYQSFAMGDTTAFAINQNIGHGSPFSSEIFAHDFLFLVISQSVQPNDTERGGVPDHVSIYHFAAFLAFEGLTDVFPLDTILEELKIITFSVVAKTHFVRMVQLFFHLLPIVFHEVILN